MQKNIMALLLVGALALGGATSAQAVDFKASGEWFVGFGGIDGQLYKGGGSKDKFAAQQRLRLQLEAIASENLSGTLQIEIGDTTWGMGVDNHGGALGADGEILTMRSAYIDWYIPSTEIQFRMGMQGLGMPNAAGGSAVFDDQVAAVVANWSINDNIGLTAFWMRPFNDNYTGGNRDNNSAGYLDNVDYFGLSVPMSFDGFEITPWVLFGQAGRNSFENGDYSLGDVMPIGFDASSNWDPSHAYSTQFYAGLPIIITALDPFTFEFDFNYGTASGLGDYSMGGRLVEPKSVSSNREGFVVKALAQYAMDWGTPGIFGWYGSGDDGSVSNGSERMPTISPSSNFTSFVQDGSNGWSLNDGYDLMLSYSGTWGIGVQLADVSFIENLSHTFRVAYWGGTNSTGMIDYMGAADWKQDGGLYLTTADHLVEFNFDTTWQIYDNLQAVVELGYIINGVNQDNWDTNADGLDIRKKDAWKAALLMMYSF